MAALASVAVWDPSVMLVFEGMRLGLGAAVARAFFGI
jgi:hypothetical protein